MATKIWTPDDVIEKVSEYMNKEHVDEVKKAYKFAKLPINTRNVNRANPTLRIQPKWLVF